MSLCVLMSNESFGKVLNPIKEISLCVFMSNVNESFGKVLNPTNSFDICTKLLKTVQNSLSPYGCVYY